MGLSRTRGGATQRFERLECQMWADDFLAAVDIRSRINSNREAALRRLSASRRAHNEANRVAALRRLNSNRCISSVTLKELPIEGINWLWFNDIKTKTSNRIAASKFAAHQRRQDTDHRRSALNFASQAGTTVLLASKGRTGLLNCGNTCFMAAAIQCLSHAVALSEYFLGDQHLASTGNEAGQLTQAYCVLLRCLWYPSELERGELASFSPRSFRDTLIQRAPQFAGYYQHDAQEFVCTFLELLHDENTRRGPDWDESALDEPALDGAPGPHAMCDAGEVWRRHLHQNKSVIVDLFHSQFRSSRTCPCGHIALKFDPFMYLSLPVQAENARECFSNLEQCLHAYTSTARLPLVLTAVSSPKPGQKSTS